MRYSPRGFDSFGSPISQWNFDLNALDPIGGRDISLISGVTSYCPVAPGLGGILYDGATVIGRSVTDAAFLLVGDITIHCIVRLILNTPSVWLVGMIGNTTSTSSTENHQWAIRVNSGGTQWEYVHERGSGTAETYTTVGCSINTRPTLLSVTRTSGVIQFYQDGLPVGSPSGTLTAPDGGSATEFLIGALQGTARIRAVVGPTQIHGSAMTADDVKEIYNRTLGRSQGFRI